MADSILRVQIIGHSFVRRLKHFISGNEEFQHQLNLGPTVLVQYSGFPGAKVSDLYRYQDTVSDFQPDLVLVIIGTNDIFHQTETPESVANGIVQYTNWLQTECGVCKVIVFPIWFRLPSLRPSRWQVDTDWFNRRVESLNRTLSAKIGGKRTVNFWRCSGIWSDLALRGILSNDGVHLSYRGNKKLYFSIRAAVVAVRKGSI